MKRVVVIGSAIVDVMAKSSVFRVMKSHQVKGGVALCEVYGGKMELEEMLVSVGGAGTNVAVGLSRLGLSAASLVRIGNDLFGEMVLADLRREGVETSLVQIDEGGKTGTSVILVASDGGRSIMTYRGVSKQIKGEEVDWEQLGKADWIQISSLGGNLSLIEDVVAFSKKEGIEVGFNPGKMEFVDLERLKKVFEGIKLLVVNKTEAQMILRRSDGEKGELARGLLKLGPKLVAVTEGKKGSALCGNGLLIEASSFKVNSVDDTGAGDAFCAGLVAGILDERKMEEALRMGVANGASEVTKLGVKTGLIYKKDLSKWLNKQVKVIEEVI
jgi:sugar/nucleoside kinase (ribokinase family)